MAGYEDNTFKPEKSMTRAEVASLLSRFVAVNENEETKKTDLKENDKALNNKNTNTENAGKNNSSSGSSSSGGSGSSSSGSKSVDSINPFIKGGTFNKEYSFKVTNKATYGSNLPSEINGNIEIKGELSSDKIVNLENLNINGTLTIDVKDAHVNLNNTKANKINVISCGKNSLEFKGTSGTKELNILDGDGVRIFVNGENVEIGIVEISPTINDAEIKLDGNFGKAEIKVIKPSRIKLNKFSKIEKFTVNSKAIFLNEFGNALKAKELCILCENFEAEKNSTEDIKKLSEEIKRLRKGDENSHKSDEVFIPNKYLRKAVNNSLGKNLDDAVTKKDMENLTKLSSDFLPMSVAEESYKSRGITDLTGLEYAINLEWVDLSENKISDLSPLKNAVNISWLELDRNYISDLTPLSDMKKLEHLNIYNNAGITDLTPICGLENLKWIDMHHCSRGKDPLNVEKLVTLKNLEYLSIETNVIEDVSFVKELPNLKTFSCNNTFVTDLEAVQDIAVRSYNDWSGEYFFNMFGQMLKSPVIVNLVGRFNTNFKFSVENFSSFR